MTGKRLSHGVYIETFGCQMNQLDSELILGNLLKDGYTIAQSKDDADVILINTCSVREHAEDRAFSNAGMLKSLKKKKAHLIMGVIGCMAENYQQGIFERLPFVDIVCGPRRFASLPGLIREVMQTGQKRIAVEDFDEDFLEPHHLPNFQSYVKVMEGCNMSCSFCIVPKVRGKESSRQPQSIIDEVKKLRDEGCVEITLLGQTVNSYKYDLADLLYELNKIDGITRIKFITSHPIFMNQKLIDAMNLEKVCKYLHIPAQSGSNRILKLMKRGYICEKYILLCEQVRSTVKNVAIASDFIVGFPTETEEDFRQTIGLMEQTRFQNCFIFKYSPRPNTAAYNLKDDIPPNIKNERNNILLDIQSRVSQKLNDNLIGSKVEVLVEGQSKTDAQKQTGRTMTNHIVVFPSTKDLKGQFVNVKIEKATSLTLFGLPVRRQTGSLV